MDNQNNKIEIIELSPQEIELIKFVRKTKYGEITILMRNGNPYQVLKITERVSLDPKK